MRNMGYDYIAGLTQPQKKRLRKRQSDLRKDRVGQIIDYAVIRELKRWAWNPKRIDSEVEYLRNLRSSKDGHKCSQSVKEYSQIRNALDRFMQPNHPRFSWNRNYKAAVESLKEEFSTWRLDMIEYHSDEDMISALTNANTNAGVTGLESGFSKKKENLVNIYSNYNKFIARTSTLKTFQRPLLIGYRTQGSGAYDDHGNHTNDCKHKTRLVSMVDMFQIFAEMQFSIPIQDRMADHRGYAGGKHPKVISSIIGNNRAIYGYYISMDYSAYDQSISDWLIRDAFGIIHCAFRSIDERLFQQVVESFIDKVFVSAEGLERSFKGVPSGSMFTQIIDSIVNWIMIRTYLNSISMRGDMIVMGDDNLLFTEGFIDPTLIATYLTKNFGITVNADKSTFGRCSAFPEFLSKEWRNNGQYRPWWELLFKLACPERVREYGNGQVTPALVIASYVQESELGMRELIDVDAFYANYPEYMNRDYVLSRVGLRNMPGAMMYSYQYLIKSDERASRNRRLIKYGRELRTGAGEMGVNTCRGA